MNQQRSHRLEISAPSMEALEDLLELHEGLDEGSTLAIGNDTKLTVEELSKSSGFDATTVILTGIVSVAVSTSSAILIEWFKSKLFSHDAPVPKGITVVIDGRKIEITQS